MRSLPVTVVPPFCVGAQVILSTVGQELSELDGACHCATLMEAPGEEPSPGHAPSETGSTVRAAGGAAPPPP